jgi:carotene epsilon-monooxygenase
MACCPARFCAFHASPAGPVSSFLVISDPAAAKHVLRATDNSNNNIYDKGLVAEVSKFLCGEGFAVAGGDQWRVRRRAVSPSLHRCDEGKQLQRTSLLSTQFVAT